MQQKKADLHVHTNFSDGTFSPSEVVKTALEKGLAAIAITDHDCVDGIEPALQSAGNTGLEVIPGIELTCETGGNEIHMLGFFIDHKQKWLLRQLSLLNEMRNKRMRKMLGCLSRFGVCVTMEDVAGAGGKGALGRLHLASVLVSKGYVSSIQEAFDKFIGNGRPCYAKGDRISPVKAISIIAKLKGVPVLAHPCTVGRDELIPVFVKAGLKGIEAYHTDNTDAATRHYKKIADDLGLLITGGSDCHGMGKGRVLMGAVTVPYEVVEKLKAAISG